MGMDALLGNNIFFLYLLGIIVIINYSFTKHQKIAIIYICTYGLTFQPENSKSIIAVLMTVSLFIYEEYLDSDLIKRKFAYRVSDKLVDFLYMYIIQYNILYVFGAIALSSGSVLGWLEPVKDLPGMQYITGSLEVLLQIISVLCLIIGIHRMFENPVKFYEFRQMYSHFKQHPYYLLPFGEPQKWEQLSRKLEMVAAIEDYTFFIREKSYSSLSLEFLKVWLENRGRRGNRKTGRCRRRINWRLIKRAVKKAALYVKMYGIPVRKIRAFLIIKIKNRLCMMAGWFKRKLRRLFRGYATIEMQLIRILAYERGLVLGRPHNFREAAATLKRKAFEVFYAKIFFRGLKRYLSIESRKPKYFRYYIVYMYLHTVQSSLNGKKFRPLDKVFQGIDVWEWPDEALFVVLLGLNSLPITEKRALVYQNIIDGYGLDWKMIQKLIACI